MSSFPKRGEIYWIKLDPTVGSEIQKTRPAVVISNDSQNKISQRIIIAPITSSVKSIFPFEVRITINDKDCKILLDQIRAIDKIRIAAFISELNNATMNKVNNAIKIALSL